jgi:hypothetical protein
MFSYLQDLIYGATKYPCALFKPKVYFGDIKSFNKEQELLHNYLLKSGFKSTVWQLVFPGQIAGLIKSVKIKGSDANEYHIRFYKDGTIDCELEVHRWSFKHWSGERKSGIDGIEVLNNIINNELNINSELVKAEINNIFLSKSYTKECIRL